MPGLYPQGSDPFTQVHQAIWTALTAYQPWSQFVPEGARINSVPPGTLSAKMKAVMPGDAPEVRILQTGWSWNDENAAMVNLHQFFSIQMNTTYLNVIPLNTLKFLTLLALLKERNNRINLGLPGLVLSWTFQGVGRELPFEDEDTGLKEWRTASIISVNMQLAYSVIGDL